MDLSEWLEEAGLGHLADNLIDQGMTLNYLSKASTEEIKELCPRMVDRIKLRLKLDAYRQINSEAPTPTLPSQDPLQLDEVLEVLEGDATESLKVRSNPPPTPDFKSTETPPTRESQDPLNELEVTVGDATESLKDKNKQAIDTGKQAVPAAPSTQSPQLIVISGGLKNSLTEFADEQWEFVQEIGTLQDKKPLQELLEHTTFGKKLLEKNKRSEPLTPKDRKSLVVLVVEHQLKILPSVRDTVRQEVWSSWANEICSLFPGEQADVYYVPYRVNERQALPASGLLHNRLITHRRYLNRGEKTTKKRKCSDSSASTSSSDCQDTNLKRVRPLPSVCICESASESASDSEGNIKWLEASSSPFDKVVEKWSQTFKLRQELLKEKSIADYFQQFPALLSPSGHRLLENDFDQAYPSHSDLFNENFPIIKTRLLELLVEKGSDVRAEPAITNLLELATGGEEQASIAALKSIPYLLKQVAPISTKIKGKKKWKPSRTEVATSFIAYVSSPSDIERCISDRVTLTEKKGISFGPFIIAVGPSWDKIQQYEVVVYKTLRYQYADIKSALTSAFKIYFALDIEYAADAAPCWMLVQRTMFKITTKFDSLYEKSVTLRELIKDCLKH